MGDVAVAEEDAARRQRRQPGDRAQQRGLAAAAGTEQHEELAVADVQRDLVDRAEPFGPPVASKREMVGSRRIAAAGGGAQVNGWTRKRRRKCLFRACSAAIGTRTASIGAADRQDVPIA
ncbi:hypothetical protein FB470_006997 [Amycolatopsis thermophila]|uniref:Uncharacterized protein n=1 Tax=Amycolatopsis thermophila TaxID=206084 RepID=A0ABU0F6I3_9PSEU|nr:hypothetical protein [Amycolatopsis thermophila]